MTTNNMPGISLTASPTKRLKTIEVGKRIEGVGFSGIYAPSFGDCLGLCLSLAHATSTIRLGTSIQPIYFRHPNELALTAAYLHEVSGGRFSLGIGVSHGPVHNMFGVTDQVGKPLSDTRAYVEAMRSATKQVGEMPPIVLATLRDKMLDLAIEIGDGAVWANASLSAMAKQAARVPADRIAAGFHMGNMLPVVVLPENASDEQIAAAADLHRRTLSSYVRLPNYRNYWHDNGYAAEMSGIAEALERKDRDAIPALMTDRWLADCTLTGTASQVREGVEAWMAAGISTPILVPSSIAGGQFVAIDELLAVYGG